MIAMEATTSLFSPDVLELLEHRALEIAENPEVICQGEWVKMFPELGTILEEKMARL